MRRFAVKLIVSVAVCGLGCSLALAATDDEIDTAINRGVEFMLNQQKPNGLYSDDPNKDWRPGGVMRGGEDSWVLVALAYAGLEMKRESMQKAVSAILPVEMDKTYAVSARIIALCHLFHQMDRERQPLVRAVIVKDLTWLRKAQGAEGQWDYPSLDNKTSSSWDLSNTQMAILALSEAAMAGFELPEDMLLKSQNLYLKWQNADGGWAHGNRSLGGNMGIRDSYGSMTAAAVASLYITRDYLYRGLGCPCAGGRSKLRPQKVDEAILRGLAWLGKNFSATGNPPAAHGIPSIYWLYSCERVGLAAGIKYFGTRNWYAEGAELLVREQNKDGSWKIINGYPLPDTAWAICFLVKGRAPILMNKLQFDGQWDNHPRDLANLVQYVAAQKEQPIRWQVINLEVPVAEWHDAPVLYISAETKIPLTDEQKSKLRRFTDTGGTVLFEASCGNSDMKTWWEKTAKEIWPEWEFKKLEKDHPVYTSDQKMSKQLSSMWEMSDGLRSIIFYAAADISCPWNMVSVAKQKEVFDFGPNLYTYATDHGKLRAPLAARARATSEGYSKARISVGSRGNISVARVKHSGDYYVGRNYDGLNLLGKAMELSGGPTLFQADEKKPEELKPAEVAVAYLTGRQGLTLSDAERKGLVDYVKDGGFLLVEAAMGDKRFDAAFMPLASELGLALRPILDDHGLITGQMGAATGYAIKGVKYKPALIADRLGQPLPQLLGLYLGDKLVGVYSPFDLLYAQTGYEAWGNRGYAADDARAILTNIFLLAASR